MLVRLRHLAFVFFGLIFRYFVHQIKLIKDTSLISRCFVVVGLHLRVQQFYLFPLNSIYLDLGYNIFFGGF